VPAIEERGIVKRLAALVAVSVVFLAFGGCGYRFAGEGPGPRPDIHRIAVPLFENSSFVPELEIVFANALRRQFMLHGRAQVVPVENADVIFRGKVLSVGIAPATQRLLGDDVSSSVTAETLITVYVGIQCVDTRDGKVIWDVANLSFSANYLDTYSQPMLTFDNRRYALENIAQEISVRIYDRFYSNF
jgi:hypothetical protein